MKNNLGSNIKMLLIEGKINESELAKRTGISQQVINRMVTGVNTNPKLETLMPIANYFSVSLQDLVSNNLQNIQKEQNKSLQIPFFTFKEMNQFGVDTAASNASRFISVELNSKPENFYFATSMYDDSMEPKFSKGSILVFEKTDQVFNGDFCLLKSDDDNNYIFRQIMINSRNKKFIKCLNPTHHEYEAILPLAVNYYVLANLLESRTVFTS